MPKVYKYIEIEQAILDIFLSKYSNLKQYLPSNKFQIRIMTDTFYGLIHSILSYNQTSDQLILQLTNLAKFKTNLFNKNKINYKKVIKIGKQKLQELLLNKTNAEAIFNIASDIKTKKIILKDLNKLNYAEICKILKKYSISNESIELFCIFTLYKPNVLMSQSVEFQKGFEKYKKDNKLDDSVLTKIKENDKTIFSLFMININNNI